MPTTTRFSWPAALSFPPFLLPVLSILRRRRPRGSLSGSFAYFPGTRDTSLRLWENVPFSIVFRRWFARPRMIGIRTITATFLLAEIS
jgi:hypothetical protein